MSGYKVKNFCYKFFVYLILGLGVVVTVIPLIWQITISLKSSNTIFETVPHIFPREFHFENYGEALEAMHFFQYFGNTLFVTILTVIGILFSCSLTAFGFSRLDFKGKNQLFFILVSTMMLPSQVTLIPLYIIYSKLGWINTYLPLIVPHFLGNAFYIFMLRQFFLTIPKELDEAALIDGCSTLRIYWNIILPLCKPAMLTVALLSFNAAWNDFMGPLIYVNDTAKYTLSLGLYVFKNSEKYGIQWNYMMAAGTIMMLPVLILYAFFQKQFIEGIATSGLKG